MDDANLAAVTDALGVPADEVIVASIVDVGAVWFTLQLRSSANVLALKPDMALLAELGTGGPTGVCVFGLHKESGPAPVEVRAFAPAAGVLEDPVCGSGSGNGCVAAMIRRHGILAGSGYVASQGRCLGRDGRVEVEYDNGTIWLGGNAVTCVDGTITV